MASNACQNDFEIVFTFSTKSEYFGLPHSRVCVLLYAIFFTKHIRNKVYNTYVHIAGKKSASNGDVSKNKQKTH